MLPNESLQCEGCSGTGILQGRMQKLIQEHRICFDIQLVCPVCLGFKLASHEDLMVFLETFATKDNEEQKKCP